jgi:hypothetical protein
MPAEIQKLKAYPRRCGRCEDNERQIYEQPDTIRTVVITAEPLTPLKTFSEEADLSTMAGNCFAKVTVKVLVGTRSGGTNQNYYSLAFNSYLQLRAS